MFPAGLGPWPWGGGGSFDSSFYAQITVCQARSALQGL